MKRYFFGAVLGFFMCLPGVTSAFDVTDTAAYQVTDDTYLFTIEFEYGYLNAEARLPLFTEHQSQSVTAAPALNYGIYENDNVITSGETAGLVISRAMLGTRQYHVEAGTRETFTLVVVYKADDNLPLTPELRVTDFTHVIKKDGQLSVMQPSATQLLDYRAQVE